MKTKNQTIGNRKNGNISVIIEEAALKNITVIIDNEKGRYAINLGDYLGAAIEHSIKVIEEAKDAQKQGNEENKKEDEGGGDKEPPKEIHLA